MLSKVRRLGRFVDGSEKQEHEPGLSLVVFKIAALALVFVFGLTATLLLSNPALRALVLGWIATSFFAISGAFKRIQAKKVLQNPVRREIIRMLRRRDGEHLTALAERLAVTRQTISYHATVLNNFNLIRLVKDGPYVRAFLQRDAGKGTAILRRSWAAKIVALLAAHPDMSVKEIAQRMGVTVATARWYLRKLEEADVLEASSGGRKSTLTVALWAERDAAVQPAGAPS